MSASAISISPLPHVTSVRTIDNVLQECGSGEDMEGNLLCPEVYLSLFWHGGQLGVAHYDMSSLQIHVMSDAFECDDFTLSKQILREIQPRLIIVSSTQDGRLITCLRKHYYEVSKRRILGMKLPCIPDHLTDEERKLYFASVLSLDQSNMIRAVGGLYKYLERKRVGVELEDSLTSVPILGFRTFAIESHIQIDPMTYLALSIFDKEIHPSGFKFGGSSSKEGLSLFGILNRCKSSIGSRKLRQWFLRPVKNAALLGQRHDAVSFFITPRNMDVVSCLQGCLKHIKYLPKILWRMSKAQATIGDLEALSKTIHHAVYIGNISRAQPQNVDIFRKIGAAFTDDLHRCANLIHRTIDFEESKKEKKFVVKQNMSEALDAKKRLFHGVPDILNQVAWEELQGLSEEIQDCKASYLPQIGYLLVTKMPEGKTENDDHTIEGLQYLFASGEQLFYKSARTRELDAQLGDIQLEITDMEVGILHALQNAILESTQVLLDVMEMAAELDCLMALATCAAEFAYVRPTFVQEDVIDIKAGRHPLQEMCCSPYVPNDTTMGRQYSRMQLLTGPNACGKSVYLKQVALIVFMAHIGSFVPAKQACFGPVERFFSRIKSMESVSSGMSTFMQDSVQISQALNGATHNSLVIVDEFGKGTESTDGLALLTAVIKFWLAKGAESPYLLISTHYHSIIQQKLLPRSTHIQFLTLDTIMNGTELVFLYQIKEGFVSSSYACHIASQVGMSQNIVKRGQKASEYLSQYKSVPHIKDGNSNAQNKRHKTIVDGFMKLNLERDNLHMFLRDFVLQANSTKDVYPRTKAGQHSKQQEKHQQHQSCLQKSPGNGSADCYPKPLPSVASAGGAQEHATSNAERNPSAGTRIEKVSENKGRPQGTVSDHTRHARPLEAVPSSPCMSEQWRRDSYREMALKKRAASCALEGRGLSTAAEHFAKTPLMGQAAKKSKTAMASAVSSYTSREKAEDSILDSGSVNSPQSLTSHTLFETLSNQSRCVATSSTSLNSAQNEKAVPFTINVEELPKENRNDKTGDKICRNPSLSSCPSAPSRSVIKRAGVDSRQMFFPPENNTDLPASSSSSNIVHTTEFNSVREKQVAQNGKALPFTINVEELPEENRNDKPGGKISRNPPPSSCQSATARSVMKRANADCRQMFFPPESNTDLPASSSSSNNVHRTECNSEREKQVAQNEKASPLTINVEELPEENRSDKTGGKISRNPPPSSCPSGTARSVMKRASADSRQMFFPPESNTDLPASSSSSNNVHRIVCNSEKEKQVCISPQNTGGQRNVPDVPTSKKSSDSLASGPQISLLSDSESSRVSTNSSPMP